MTKIAPSMLSADFAYLKDALDTVADSGADWIHLDVMDGVLVPNLSFGLTVVKALRPHSKMFFDCHLMIIKPENYVSQFVDAGADLVTFHPRGSECPEKCIAMIKEKGAKAGIALNPDVAWEDYTYLLKDCDVVVIMGVYAGFGGQKLIPETVEKVRALREYIDNNGLTTEIEFDGGITADNAKSVATAGAEILVAGTAFFKSDDKKATVAALKI